MFFKKSILGFYKSLTIQLVGEVVQRCEICVFVSKKLIISNSDIICSNVETEAKKKPALFSLVCMMRDLQAYLGITRLNQRLTSFTAILKYRHERSGPRTESACEKQSYGEKKLNK